MRKVMPLKKTQKEETNPDKIEEYSDCKNKKNLRYGNRKQRWEPCSGKENTERHREHRVSQSYLLRVIVLTVKIKMFTPIF